MCRRVNPRHSGVSRGGLGCVRDSLKQRFGLDETVAVGIGEPGKLCGAQVENLGPMTSWFREKPGLA